ncbi:MAG: nucleotidyltransferase family protein [Oscillospiraceae bacterium]|nr:nucleotidyltransferase family protein [Oscillospiraceae bacterium]
MRITGVICEYNPLHRGHLKQLELIRAKGGNETGIVCLMSGNFVQRGMPAIIDKTKRAEGAVMCGADLVLELPVTAALSSAEGFAAEGIRLLSPFCHRLCFGAETANEEVLLTLAKALLSPEFSEALRQALDLRLSFPAARQRALEAMGLDGAVLASPNNILAVEYCKAILAQGSCIEPWPIHRAGDYHNTAADLDNPSATAVRRLMVEGKEWAQFVPKEAADCFRGASLHTLKAGERAVLARLRTMRDEEFEALPFGSEGLWRKLMHAARQEASLDAVAEAVKSKRYTRTRIDRMILCAFLGLTAAELDSPAPWARVLAFNDRGREILKLARESADLPNLGEKRGHPYQAIEDRCDALYGLFAENTPEPPDPKYRVYCKR